MITCKSCGKRLSELCFYSSVSYKNNKLYKKTYHMCKKCIRLKTLSSQHITKETEPIEVHEEFTLDSYSWVLRNLRKFGNCYIKHLSKVNISELSNKLGFDLNVRPTDKENKGYIIEVIK